MSVLALTLLFAAVDARANTVLDAVAEPGCPRLFPMLSDRFARDFPAEKWPSWCEFVGKLEGVEDLGTKDGWLKYRGTSRGRKILFDVAFDGAGKVAGLMALTDDSLPPAELKLTLAEQLARVRQDQGLPALAVLVLRDGREAEIAATGVRKQGDPTAVTTDDRWHLGSDTKAMTATLAAILVEEKRIAWTSTVAEVLSDWKDLNPAQGKVTLEMLLAHRGGLPPHVNPREWGKMWDAPDQIKQRRETVHTLLRGPPGKIGEFLYSNFGYLVAGVMLEKVTGLSWEAAIKKRLFEPLKMTSCGFGGPASRGKIDHPWAHQRHGETLSPVAPGPRSDNPASLGPAGTVHCSLRDWGKFVQMHLDGGRGQATMLAAATIKKLHTPVGGQAALGWGVGAHKGSPVLSHDGSNTLFFARVWMLPARNVAFLIATNAADRLVSYLRARHLP
jgi:D-alanyl-D-alanine carboxypeptidase